MRDVKILFVMQHTISKMIYRDLEVIGRIRDEQEKEGKKKMIEMPYLKTTQIVCFSIFRLILLVSFYTGNISIIIIV